MKELTIEDSSFCKKCNIRYSKEYDKKADETWNKMKEEGFVGPAPIACPLCQEKNTTKIMSYLCNSNSRNSAEARRRKRCI